MFDLEEFKKGKTALTRNGFTATFVAQDDLALEDQRVIYRVNGCIYLSDVIGKNVVDNSFGNLDLIDMKPEIKDVYVNFYENGVCRYFLTEQSAKYFARNPGTPPPPKILAIAVLVSFQVKEKG